MKKFLSCLGKIFAFFGALLGLTSFFNNHKARRENKKANEIKDKAFQRYEKCKLETENALGELGSNKKEALNLLSEFKRILEELKKKYKIEDVNEIELFSIQPQDIKVIRANLDIALEGAVEAIAIAAFGLNPLLGPVALASGVVLCKRAVSLKKAAVENLNEAKKLEKQIESIESYYEELRNGAKQLSKCIEAVKPIYEKNLTKLSKVIDRKLFKSFSDKDKQLLENVIHMSKLLYSICSLKLIINEDENGIEEVDKLKIEECVARANFLLEANKVKKHI